MPIDPEKDAAATAAPTDAALSTLSQLANALQAKQAALADAEALVRSLKDEVHALEAHQLPEAMEELGMESFTLKNGSRITVRSIVRASLPTPSAIARTRDPEKAEALRERYVRGLEQLKAEGAESLVRTVLEADLGKGSGELAELARAQLRELGLSAEVNSTVHSGSLSAYVRERLEHGQPVDFDLYGVYLGKQAVVK